MYTLLMNILKFRQIFFIFFYFSLKFMKEKYRYSYVQKSCEGKLLIDVLNNVSLFDEHLK